MGFQTRLKRGDWNMSWKEVWAKRRVLGKCPTCGQWKRVKQVEAGEKELQENEVQEAG